MKLTYLASLALAGLLLGCGGQQVPEAPVVNPPVEAAAPLPTKSASDIWVCTAGPKDGECDQWTRNGTKGAEVPKATKAPKAKKPVAVKKQKKAAAPKAAPKVDDEAAARRDCTADAFQFCAWAIPLGRDSIIKCMVSNRSKLSKQCQAHVR